MVDAGVGHDETEPVLDNQQARAMTDDPFRFGQHHLDKTRVLVDLGGERDGALAVSTYRPSALETIFCATTRTSPASGMSPLARSAATVIAPRSSPGST